MVTNEEILLSYPEEIVRIAEVCYAVDSFEATFDSVDSWLLRTPFDATTSGMQPGMIVRLTRVGTTNSHSGIYIIDSVSSEGFELKVAGFKDRVGRGPSTSFGIDAIKVKVYDFTPAIESAQRTVDASSNSAILENDQTVVGFRNEAVKRIAVLRLASNIESLRTILGMKELSHTDLERQVIEKLNSEILPHLWKQCDGSARWTRFVR